MSEKHTCPRRAEDGMDDPTAPFKGAGRDKDTYSKGHGFTRQERGCSYCGSMHPDDFLQAMRDGAELGVTDKTYKAYVDGHAGKFYYQHLDKEQRTEFILMLNSGTIRFGWPGQFTVLPYFIKKADPA